ncbi:SDR family oxidoreductase [Natronorubrum sp. FCH18a]|uniref:SDR family oxidoreductase n=1 Tax=Natronorubrum sp. FCH18a TaxID=3447018 RepID=UPI003F51A8E2
MDLELAGKSALVMAASSGLGRATATQLAAEGAEVAISSRSQENLEEAKNHIVEETNANESAIHPIVCDLSDSESIRPAVERSIDELDGLDVLVTNHGGTTPKYFADATVEEFDDHYNSILKSTIIVVKAALPALKESGGSMTHLVAATAREPPTGLIFTSTIRSGLFGLSKSLATEYAADNIRSNCVCPRSIMTDRIESKTEQVAQRDDVPFESVLEDRKVELPIGRLGTPEEFARTVTYVASPAAGFLTGTVIPVDGGWSKSTQ